MVPIDSPINVPEDLVFNEDIGLPVAVKAEMVGDSVGVFF